MRAAPGLRSLSRESILKRQATNTEVEMARGYWIAQVDVTDAEGYKAYIRENASAFHKFGGRFLVRGGRSEVVEGQVRSRTVVIEFEDYATALACYRSPEYAKALTLRTANSIADVLVIEGYDGPQPGDG
jgi:uncharacterized protein (DUF1330 family)